MDGERFEIPVAHDLSFPFLKTLRSTLMHLVKLAQRRLRSFWKINMCLTLKKNPQEVRRSPCQFLQLRFGWTLMDFDGPRGRLSRRWQQLTWIQCSQAVRSKASVWEQLHDSPCLYEQNLFICAGQRLRLLWSSSISRTSQKVPDAICSVWKYLGLSLRSTRYTRIFVKAAKKFRGYGFSYFDASDHFAKIISIECQDCSEFFLIFTTSETITYPLSTWTTEPRRTFHLCPSNHWESPFKSYFKSFANMADVLNENHIIKLLCLDLSVHLWRRSIEKESKNPRRFQAKPLNFDCLPSLPTSLTKIWTIFNQGSSRSPLQHTELRGAELWTLLEKKPPMAKSTMASCIYTKKTQRFQEFQRFTCSLAKTKVEQLIFWYVLVIADDYLPILSRFTRFTPHSALFYENTCVQSAAWKCNEACDAFSRS